MKKYIPLQQKSALARKALIRHTSMPSAPESKLIVEIFVQAISDSLVRPSAHLKKAEKRSAEAFLLKRGCLDAYCSLVGLEPEYVRFVAERIRAA